MAQTIGQAFKQPELGILMKWIPLAMAFATSTPLLANTETETKEASAPEFVLHFDDVASEPEWHPVNDGVMGGLSEGGSTMEDGVLVFAGHLSLENNGGFASVRTRGGDYNFATADGIALRVKGDGRTYQLRVATDARHRGSLVSYQRKFETREGKWVEVKVPFDELKPGWRGRMLSGHVFDHTKVSQLGILIGDKKEGPFRLEVDWLKTYRHDEDER